MNTVDRSERELGSTHKPLDDMARLINHRNRRGAANRLSHRASQRYHVVDQCQAKAHLMRSH